MKFRDYMNEGMGVEKLFKSAYTRFQKTMEKNSWTMTKQEKASVRGTSITWQTWEREDKSGTGIGGSKAVLSMDDWVNKPEGTYLLIHTYDWRGMGNKSVAQELAHELKKGGLTANATTVQRIPAVLILAE